MVRVLILALALGGLSASAGEVIYHPFGASQLESYKIFNKKVGALSSIFESGHVPGQYSWSYIYRYQKDDQLCAVWIELPHAVLPGQVVINTCDQEQLKGLAWLFTAISPWAKDFTTGAQHLDQRFGIDNITDYQVRGVKNFFYKRQGCEGTLTFDDGGSSDVVEKCE